MRYLGLILLFSIHLFGEDFFDTIVEKVYVSHDLKTYRDATIDDYLSDKKNKQVSIKLSFNKKRLKNETYYLTVVSDFSSLIDTNSKYDRKKNILIIKLDKKNTKPLYFTYKYEIPKKTEFRYDVISKFEHDYILYNEGIVYGIAYGIIFCAFLYYFIIYFSTRQKAFLYYSIMQLFVLLSLIGFVYISFLSYTNQNSILTLPLIDIFETSSFLFTLLFAKEILNTKKISFFMNKILNLFIILNILDILAIFYFKYSILYEYLPFKVGFFLPFIAGLIAIYKKVNYAAIYTFGWFVMLFTIYLIESFTLPISNIYIIHVAAPLESLIFSFALGLMLKKIIDDKNKKEKLLIHKNKLSSMGEMLNNISHQWKQPLSNMNLINYDLKMNLNEDDLDKKHLKKISGDFQKQIDHMSETLDLFKGFYMPTKNKEEFFTSELLENVMDIIKPVLLDNNIELRVNIEKDNKVTTYKSELLQIFLNIISNSKDALLERKVENPYINISLNIDKDKRTLVSFEDNAGGIDKNILTKIFDPYFTTKHDSFGIGLYMSEVIMHSHIKGEIEVKNTSSGACFKLKF